MEKLIEESTKINYSIKVVDIEKSFRERKILDKINFLVKKGTIHGFIGPNGSGKTTIMNIIVKLIIADEGNVFIENESIEENFFTNEKIGYVPAETSGMGHLEVEDFIVNSNIFKGKLERKEIIQLIENSPIKKFRYKLFSDLSTGWKKIVQFFAVSLSKPDIFLLDEPFNGLDPIMRSKLFEKIIKLKSEGKTIFISTHILSDLQKMADDITIIEKGKIIFSGPKTSDIEKTYENLFFSIKKEEEDNFFEEDPFTFL